MFYGLTFLPALLAVLGPNVNRLSIPIVGRRPKSGRGAWHRMATWVMRRPVLVLVPALGFLVLAGSPFLHLRLANASIDQLPPRLESRQGFDTLVKSFPGQDQTDFSVVVNYGSGSPTTAARVLDQADLSRRIATIPGVLRVAPPQVGAHIVLLDAVSNQPASSDGARTILRAIRAESIGNGGQILVTGRHGFRRGYHQLHHRQDAAGGRLRCPGHLPGSLPAHRVAGAAAEGRGAEPALDLGVVRGLGVDLPGRAPEPTTRLHRPVD